jgi:hopanoid biosynthesis associated protein HpnK
MKRLIITADDFGLSSSVNRAVEQAWNDGILTCASLMPGAAAFDEAVAIAGRNPGLQIGLHLTLAQGRSVLAKAELPDLVDSEGNFADIAVMAGMRYFFDRGLYCQLKREIEAQIQKMIAAGIRLTHIDGHLNIHLHPTVFRILCELMPRYGISTFRLARERLAHNLRFDGTRGVGKSLENLIFGFLTKYAVPELDLLGVGYADEVKGVLSSGRMTKEYFLSIVEGLQDGVTECYFHPGILPDPEITRRMPAYRHQDELAALLSSAVQERLRQLQVTLQNYRGEAKC